MLILSSFLRLSTWPLLASVVLVRCVEFFFSEKFQNGYVEQKISPETSLT